MDRVYFLHLDDCLKSAISDGIKLNENENLWFVMERISLRACLLYSMRNVAYKKVLSQPFRDERDCYFAGLELILGQIYSDFFKVPFERRIRMYVEVPFSPKTNNEKFRVIQKINEFAPKLKTSWIEKAWKLSKNCVKNDWWMFLFIGFFNY